MRKKLLLATGGTGGHIYPALKLKEALKDFCDVELAGVRLKEGITISGGPLSLRSLPKIAHGIFLSDHLLRHFSPNLVIGFGSYHSFPLLIAAKFRKTPIWLFEANRVMGRVNSLFAKKAKVFSTLPSNFATPISFPQKPLPKPNYSDYNLKDNLPTILVLGGSQGAKSLNEKIPTILDQIEGIQVLHLTGKNKTAQYKKAPATIIPFEKQMERAYSVADFVIARAGSGTVTELLHYQKPSLLIPYPGAIRDHQAANATYLEELGVATMVREEEICETVVKENFEKRTQATFSPHNFPSFVELIKKELA